MSRKGPPNKHSIWDNPFGGVFDFNGDGREDLGEQWIAYQIYNECHNDNGFSGAGTSLGYEMQDVSWRDLCEDGSDFGVDPYDYDYEDEYEEALSEAKAALQNDHNYYDDDDDDDDDDDYETLCNEIIALVKAALDRLKLPIPEKLESIDTSCVSKRLYNAILSLKFHVLDCPFLEYNDFEKECCLFILCNVGKLVAASYLSYTGGFLYSQAIKDNFELPISLPDEDENRELEFAEILEKIAKRDIPLSFKVWSWALEQFLPYAQYDRKADYCMTSGVIKSLNGFPEAYTSELVRYMDEDPTFAKALLEAKCEIPFNMSRLIATALGNGLYATALMIFKSTLTKAGEDWREINRLAKYTVGECKNYKEVESIEYFRDNMLPLVKAIQIGMVQDEIEEWESIIAEYIAYVVAHSKKYTYERENAWRLSVPNGKIYGLDPRSYDSEKKYLADLETEKRRWRKKYRGYEKLGLNVDDFDSERKFRNVYNTLKDESQRKRREEAIQRQQQAMDETIYTICGVNFYPGTQPDYYLSDDRSLVIGDAVVVPNGEREDVGRIVSIGQFLREAAPYPVNRLKKIKRRLEDKEE